MQVSVFDGVTEVLVSRDGRLVCTIPKADRRQSNRLTAKEAVEMAERIAKMLREDER